MFANKVRHALVARNMTVAELAEKINTTPQNLHNKLKNDNFREGEMITIAEALNCNIELFLKLRDLDVKY